MARPRAQRALDRVERGLNLAGDRLGTAVEAMFRRRHRQRLLRTGHLRAGQPIAALPVDTHPLRTGNSVRILIDGDEAFAAMAQAIRRAKCTINLCGWAADPRFVMCRGAGADHLGRAARRGVRARGGSSARAWATTSLTCSL